MIITSIKKQNMEINLVYKCLSLQHTDMSDEMKTETMELIVTACEKHLSNNEVRNTLNILNKIYK